MASGKVELTALLRGQEPEIADGKGNYDVLCLGFAAQPAIRRNCGLQFRGWLRSNHVWQDGANYFPSGEALGQVVSSCCQLDRSQRLEGN